MFNFQLIHELRKKWKIPKLPGIHRISDTITLHPCTLAFTDKTIEAEYNAYTIENSLWLIRLGLYLGILLYGIFGFLDAAMAPENYEKLWIIRYAIVIPIVAVSLITSYIPAYKKHIQIFMFFVLLATGSGITVMVALTPEEQTFAYYTGIILVLMLGYGISKIKFVWATIIGWFHIFFYNITAVFLTQTPGVELLNNNFFFISANVIGMLTCYTFEINARKHFFSEKLLIEEHEKVNQLNNSLEMKVAQRTVKLEEANSRLLSEMEAHKRAERDKFELQNHVNQIQKMESIGNLAGGIAHDFNNMLGVIIGYSELSLLEVEESSTAYKQIQEILKAAQHSAALTRQLLAFARKQPISPVYVDLNTTLLNYTDLIRNLIGEQITLQVLPSDSSPRVFIDETQLTQIITNLCVNSRDAMQGGSGNTITLQTDIVTIDESFCKLNQEAVPGSFALLTISDTGCGMDPDTLKKIAEPFFTTKAIAKGTGMGFSTVYGIVKQNRGFISISSTVGIGTTIHVYLPHYAEIAATQHASDKRTEAVPDFKHKTILLVEDEAALLELNTHILEEHGFQVIAVNSPKEAILKALDASNLIDILVTDVVMPDMNGKELADRVTEINPGILHIYMSGYTADIIEKQGFIVEENEFLQKPFTPKQLLDKINTLLKLQQAKESRN